MKYAVNGYSNSNGEAKVEAKSSVYKFGIKANQTMLAGPAELLLSSFAACCLKNIERLSKILNYTYQSAEIEVTGMRQVKPSMFSTIDYTITIHSDDDNINVDILLKNLQKFGTIYNTLHSVCTIHGEILVNESV